MTKPGELIDVKKAAAILDCTPEHIRNKIVNGELEATRIGPKVFRVYRASLEKLIEKNKVNPEDFFK